jgi:hypothetical protein
VGHNCCQTGHGAGCSNPAIQACVCAVDPFCCDIEWDNICVGEVQGLNCGSCSPPSDDCNSNDVPDECDPDGDNDGLIDDCDPCPNRKPGDVNGDGFTNGGDLLPFVTVLLDPPAASADNRCAADTNADTLANGLDTKSFVGLILAP